MAQKYTPSFGKPLLCCVILHTFVIEASAYENRRTETNTINYSGSRVVISKCAQMNLSYDITTSHLADSAGFELKQDTASKQLRFWTTTPLAILTM